ncbi:hypothetical protein GCM10022251_75050 [Phytohabitans flavus]|uniref:Uncharacterized protein n=1 Tax=Phytohabitans flavus TaxID=1076124 RepID=A0A6F8XLE8_9ACTN|nr:hypothetical protein [Phytohabitans flavus]BCB74636.1 hypothetical protein Pflav_010460 [Phytohabitans flavus]
MSGPGWARWELLYLRAREVPAAAALLPVTMLAVGVLANASAGPSSTAPAVVGVCAALLGVAFVGTTLGSADAVLEHTAAIRWWPRRTVHLVAGTIAVVLLLLAVDLAGPSLATTAELVRNTLGLIGVTALCASFTGSRLSWCPAAAWTLLAVVAGPRSSGAGQVLSWMLQPADARTAATTAALLAVSGAASYILAGPAGLRRA